MIAAGNILGGDGLSIWRKHYHDVLLIIKMNIDTDLHFHYLFSTCIMYFFKSSLTVVVALVLFVAYCQAEPASADHDLPGAGQGNVAPKLRRRV